MRVDQKRNDKMTPAVDATEITPFSPKTPEDFQYIEEAVNLFTGMHRHGLDSKGRVIVPQVFRKKLGDTFVIGPSKDFKAVAIYPTLVWAKYMHQLKSLGEHLNPSVAKQIKMMTTYSSLNQECDAQGRILLPAVLRQRILGEERDVNITGNNDYVCITTRQADDNEWDLHMSNMETTAEQIYRAFEQSRTQE